ncbi:conserved Plasmodium protein, unknown function [Plasmodium gallinaceum]|uniref:Uncharacterized protein n=1 Tax=Plasmodium gallinaceum TaxID=5849 RepID=A0A1J1GYU3_PLAGA|nr:conserved Plasmodium protein, unknown function [Plasmodium gallinaceum]CRG97487.1 conserved Plasmodium protein, unknown function [Plasmodium gallinaceum]
MKIYYIHLISFTKLPLCYFTTVQLYKPSKFKDIKKKLYLKKKFFKIFNKKQDSDIKNDTFYNIISEYQKNKIRIYKNNKFNICENFNKSPSLENILFKSTTFGYLELQYILSTFLDFEKNRLKKEDILTLSNFFNLSEKEIYDYLCGNELIPKKYSETEVIKSLLKFINVNHPSLN